MEGLGFRVAGLEVTVLHRAVPGWHLLQKEGKPACARFLARELKV